MKLLLLTIFKDLDLPGYQQLIISLDREKIFHLFDYTDKQKSQQSNNCNNYGLTRKIIAYINVRTNEQDADKITLLNITYLRYCPLRYDLILEALRLTARIVFVLLTVGDDIKDIIDVGDTRTPTSEVTSQYFRSGANKVSVLILILSIL